MAALLTEGGPWIPMSQQQISFIGGGNMATALLGGLVAHGWPVAAIRVVERSADKRADLSARFGVQVFSEAGPAVAAADILLFAVKPQGLAEAVAELADAISAVQPLVISIAAGVREPDIRRWLGYDAAIVRTMPNTPALLGKGASALYANPFVDTEQRAVAVEVLQAVGLALWVKDEAELDAVTALSGSGPAYFFLLMELMAKTGEELGLAPETALQLTLQTALGAATMAQDGEAPPAELRQRVTSPKGTTERALQSLERDELEAIVARALRAARDRSVELGDVLGAA